uniref:Putative mannosyltransferase n=1 Tax=Corethrella appendiculata TaxID=1370023 RepID=U5EJF4_9DIPT
MINYLEYFTLVLIFSLIYNLNTAFAAKNKYVTCGTVLKLLNTDYNVRLHSHDVKYGTGSGQQSVTATEVQEDVNSHWQINAPTGKFCERGESIKCGDIIRLYHLATNKNLHSHHFQSPLSGNQEISCYGNDNGEGDSSDHRESPSPLSLPWLRDMKIKLRHVDTDSFLGVSGRTFGRPINGQMEVIGTHSSYSGAEWKAAEGLFVHPKEKDQYSGNVHTEL